MLTKAKLLRIIKAKDSTNKTVLEKVYPVRKRTPSLATQNYHQVRRNKTISYTIEIRGIPDEFTRFNKVIMDGNVYDIEKIVVKSKPNTVYLELSYISKYKNGVI